MEDDGWFELACRSVASFRGVGDGGVVYRGASLRQWICRWRSSPVVVGNELCIVSVSSDCDEVRLLKRASAKTRFSAFTRRSLYEATML